jgi:DNA polymerase/3'-5' exonuclease PolX
MNKDIAKIFREMAELLNIKGDPPFLVPRIIGEKFNKKRP